MIRGIVWDTESKLQITGARDVPRVQIIGKKMQTALKKKSTRIIRGYEK